MKRIGLLLVLVSLGLFSIGCKPAADTAPADADATVEAPADAAADAPAEGDVAPAEAAPEETPTE